MRLNNVFVFLSAAGALLGLTLTSSAQQTPPIVPGTHQAPRMGGMHSRVLPGSGQIIGNKNTRVYHLPGDRGNMPSEKNRVYFRTEREAIAAGYHSAGSVKKPNSGMNHRMPHTMSHTVKPMPGGSGTQGSRTTDTGGHLPK